MPNQLDRLTRSAAIAILCLLIPSVAATAQQSRYRQTSARASNSYADRYVYQTPAVNPVGIYSSDAFYPSPLTLRITGMDRYGNLSGSMSGWRSEYTPDGGETGNTWHTWQRVFGQDSRAFYRDGKINIAFDNGASYVLDYRGTQLDGQFVNGSDRVPILFMKSAIAAAR